MNNVFIEHLRNKNPAAWAIFFKEHRNNLRKVIGQSLSKYNVPYDRVDDIEQKAWLTAYQKIDQFEQERDGGLFGWLCLIQFNHVRNLSREVMVDTLDDGDGERGDDEPTASMPALRGEELRHVESEIISRETRREVYSALDLVLQDLSAHHREIALRRILWKEDANELAEQYGLKVETIYQISSRAKRRLRDYLLAPDLFFRAHSDKTGKDTTPWKK
jgi:RNA polymerase sigma factor (sigma-70 family)